MSCWACRHVRTASGMSRESSSRRDLAVAIAGPAQEGFRLGGGTRRGPMAQGRIFVGIGGWTYEPWRGVFYPEGLTQKRELEFASRALTSIEINGTYYSTFKQAS